MESQNVPYQIIKNQTNHLILKYTPENHYYPFGLKHSVYADNKNKIEAINNNTQKAVNPDNPVDVNSIYARYDYKYNGKEFQDELGLNLYDYGARNYDPALGRWMNIDPLAHRYSSSTPYNYGANNPVFFIDIDGMKIINGDKEKKEEVDKQIERRTKELDDRKAEHGGISTKKEFIAKYGKKEGKAEFEKINKFEKALNGLKNESKELGKQIANTEAKIKELKENAPNMFDKLDNLTNEYGETVDVYLHSSDYLGSNDGQTEMGYHPNESGSEIRPLSNFGINTIQARLINSPSGNRTTLEVIKHELGHVDYQGENTAAYYNYLKENNRLGTKYGGHAPNDPSGVRAEEYQNITDLP